MNPVKSFLTGVGIFFLAIFTLLIELYNNMEIWLDRNLGIDLDLFVSIYLWAIVGAFVYGLYLVIREKILGY